MHRKDANGMTNSIDPDQEQSDLGLHCLHITVRSKTWNFMVRRIPRTESFFFCFFNKFKHRQRLARIAWGIAYSG